MFFFPFFVCFILIIWLVFLFVFVKFPVAMRTRSSVSLFASPPPRCAIPARTRCCRRDPSCSFTDIPGDSAAPRGRGSPPARIRSCRRSRSCVSVDLRRESTALCRSGGVPPSRTHMNCRNAEEFVIPPTRCMSMSRAQTCRRGCTSVNMTNSEESAVQSCRRAVASPRVNSARRGRKRKFNW